MSEPPLRPKRMLLGRRTRSLDLIARVHVAVLAIGLVVAALWLFSDVLLLLFAAALLAAELRGAALFVSHCLRLSYGIALALVVPVQMVWVETILGDPPKDQAAAGTSS